MATIYVPDEMVKDVEHLKLLRRQGRAYNITLYCKEDNEKEEEKFPHTLSREEEKEKEESQQHQSITRTLGTNIPTLQEIEEYAKLFERLDFTPQRFYDLNSERDWMIAGKPIKDWKAIFRLWAKNANAKDKHTYISSNVKTDNRVATLLHAESRNQEKAERETAERNARLDEQKQMHVSYEEYLRMKKAKSSPPKKQPPQPPRGSKEVNETTSQRVNE